MIILKNKLKETLWKQYILFKHVNKSRISPYQPKNNIEKFINDKLLELTYTNIPTYKPEAIFKYISILEELISKSDVIDKDKNKAKKLIEKLELIDSYYLIKNKLYPQITISEGKIYRFYYHPFFNLNIKYIRNLYKLGFLKDKNLKVYYFDINAALLRTFFYYLYKKYNYDNLLKLYYYKNDLYTFLQTEVFKPLSGNVVNRDIFKNDIVSLLMGKEKVLKKFEYKYQANKTKLQKFIFSNLLEVDTYKLTILHHYLLLNELSKNSNINLPFFNYDGGIIITDNKPNLPKSYNIELIK